jgi:hypothetical protein
MMQVLENVLRTFDHAMRRGQRIYEKSATIVREAQEQLVIMFEKLEVEGAEDQGSEESGNELRELDTNVRSRPRKPRVKKGKKGKGKRPPKKIERQRQLFPILLLQKIRNIS